MPSDAIEARATTKLDLRIPQRGTYAFTVNVIGGPPSIQNYVGAMQIRESKDSNVVLAEIASNNITVNHLTNQVTVTIPSAQTEAWTWEDGVYDLYIVGAGGRWRLVEGRVHNSISVTRED